MEGITGSEVAGLGVGALLLVAAMAAPNVDFFIASSQRRTLRLCDQCGGITKLPCGKCKGRGQVKQDIFSSPFQSRLSGSLEDTSCQACQGRGQLPCPTCGGVKASQMRR